ncbi:MAG: 3'-5' exonuclease [Candidatus Izemoplasma sp.]|nr:3'-5' exonuclease [Candidatus Izemoplasma sp.]
MDYVVFDIETTGLNPRTDRIIEIGALRIKNGEVVDSFEQLINPGITIPDNVIAIHGITNEMVKDALFPGIALQEFISFCEGVDFLIGHNAVRFDYPFIENECTRYMVKYPKFRVKDTIFSARKRLKGLRSYSLKALCRIFQIENKQAHRALSDVYATYEVYEQLLAKDK